MPDSIKFSELPSGTLGANSLFATAEEAGGGTFASTKVNAANVGNYLTGVLQYAGINTEDKTVEGALNELLTYASNIAEEYDSTDTYDVGDFVIYSGVLYKCIVAISTPEEWTSAHWTSTLVVDNFGAGGGASVTLGTTAPSDASGENGDLYVQYEALTYKVVEYFVKINGSWRKAPYSRVVALTQAEYDLITPDPTTLYIITDAQSSYQTKTDANLQTTATTVVGAINELKSGKASVPTSVSGVAYNSNKIDSGNLYVYRIDKMIFVKAYLKVKNTLTDGDVILTGLPTRFNYRADNTFPIEIGNEFFNSTSDMKAGFIDASNQFCIATANSIDNTRVLLINFWYLSV